MYVVGERGQAAVKVRGLSTPYAWREKDTGALVEQIVVAKGIVEVCLEVWWRSKRDGFLAFSLSSPGHPLEAPAIQIDLV